MQKNLISVIIPVYNVEKYLNKCIESVVNQTYKNFEVILIDDGSTDQSPTICENWTKKDSRIKVYHKENGGLSDARNSGLAKARGDYVAFVDSDDYVHFKYLEILLKNLLENNAEISVCNYLKVTEGKKVLEEEIDNNTLVYEGKKIIDQIYDNNSITVVAWNKLYKKQLFEIVKYPEDRVHEDEYVIHQLLYQCQKVVYTSCKLYYYLQRNNSITSKFSLKRVKDAVTAFEQRALFFRKENEHQYEDKAWNMWFWIIQRYEECAREEFVERIIDRDSYRTIKKYLIKQLKESVNDPRWDCLNKKDSIYIRGWMLFPDIVKGIKKFNKKIVTLKEKTVYFIKTRMMEK